MMRIGSMGGIPIETSCHAILDFSGDHIEPGEILNLVSVRPAFAIAKGESLSAKRPELSQRARTGYCGFSTNGHVYTEDINDHIEFLLDEVENNLTKIERIIREKNVSWKITCFFSESHINLCANLRESIVDRAKNIGINLVRDKGSVTVIWDGI
ncbi:MAG: DUF4279 domain-containing protein [Terriglobia bacterium]